MIKTFLLFTIFYSLETLSITVLLTNISNNPVHYEWMNHKSVLPDNISQSLSFHDTDPAILKIEDSTYLIENNHHYIIQSVNVTFNNKKFPNVYKEDISNPSGTISPVAPHELPIDINSDPYLIFHNKTDRDLSLEISFIREKREFYKLILKTGQEYEAFFKPPSLIPSNIKINLDDQTFGLLLNQTYVFLQPSQNDKTKAFRIKDFQLYQSLLKNLKKQNEPV